MLSHLLDVLDEKKDAERLDALLDENENLFFNLILYYYAPKPEPKPVSASSSSSPPLPSQPQPSSIDYTLQEQTLCSKIAKFTAMHPSHIFDSYNRVKSVAIDTFAIHEIQIWNYVFEERQRMLTALLGMLNYIIECEAGSSLFANSICNHIQGWIHKGWKHKIVECYTKLTADGLPDHLPYDLRPKYCEYIAQEQLLLWKLIFLLYYEPITARLEDIDLFFKLYPLSLKKVIPIYMNKCSNSFNSSKHKIHEIMKKIDDLLIAVFMELLPVEHVHGHVEQFEFIVHEQRELNNITMNPTMADPAVLTQIQNKLERTFSKTQSNNHLRNIWKIYSDLAHKLAKFVKLTKDANATDLDIYEEIEKINNKSDDAATVTDAVTPANLINCFEKMLITFGDCDDSKCFVKPIQCLIKSYLDAILSKDPDVLVDSDNIHYIYQHILTDNHEQCKTFFEDQKLQRFPLWKYAVKSFITQPYLKLGLLASLCSSPSNAQHVYEIFSHNKGYFTLKSQVEPLIATRRETMNQNQYYAKDTFEWNFIQIARGAKGTITKGRDGMTEIMCWDTEWNGFLWLLSLLTHCIHPHAHGDSNHPMNHRNTNKQQHNIAYMARNALPSAMRLLTKLTAYYPEAIQLIAKDIQSISVSNRKYVGAHPTPLFKALRQYPHMEQMSLYLFIHCMQRLQDYDYAAHSITNALHSTKDNYDWNLDLFKDATAFFKFIAQQSTKNMIHIIHRHSDPEFFSKLIMTVIGVMSQCIHNAKNQMCQPYGDELAYEKSQYQLKCVWNVIGYLIDIVSKIFINRDIFYFEDWELDITQYIHTILGIYPAIYPTTCLDIYVNDKTELDSHSIELHHKATNLVYNIVKGEAPFARMIIDRFCDDIHDSFRNFIIDPIIYSNELLTYFASTIRSSDQRLMSEIIGDSIKILENIFIHSTVEQRQEIMIKIEHKLNANVDRRDTYAFEKISFADKICQLLMSLNHPMHTNVVYECIKFLKFLCHILPGSSYQDLFNSMTEIERLSEWMTQYLDIAKWRKQSDVKKACHLMDLLCIFMSNQNRLRHMLLKPHPNKLLTLLFQIMKHKDSFTKYSHITAKCLQIFWLLHSDLDASVYPFIQTMWQPIAHILSSDLQSISTTKPVEAHYVTRCWQNECFAWCFRLLLQEIEQTLSFFDEIDVGYSNRRKSINRVIHQLAIEKQLFMKWMQVIIDVPRISVDLLNKRENIAMDYKIQLSDFRSDAVRLFGDYKDYGRNCVDKYYKLMNKLRLLSLSAEFVQQQQARQGQKKRNHVQELSDVAKCIQVIEEFNVQKSLSLSHHLMLTAWSDLIQHICLCSPHIIGLLPITCYNKKLSESHLEATLNRIRSISRTETQTQTHRKFVSPSKRDLNREQSIKQLFHWNILHSLPKPKKQSAITSHFCVQLSKMLNTAFKHMMDPKYFNLNENVLNCPDLETHLSDYLSICAVLRDIVNHLTQQDLQHAEEAPQAHDTNVLTFDLSKTIFVNIAECIQIASQFAANRSTIGPSPHKRQRLSSNRVPMVDHIMELLLMIAMVLIKWMLHYGPKNGCHAGCNPNVTFISSSPMEVEHNTAALTPIKKRLSFTSDNNHNHNNNNNNNNGNKCEHDAVWINVMSGCSQILSALCSTSSHLIVCDDHVHMSSAVCIFPYLIDCMRSYTNVSLTSIAQHGFIKYCMNHFASISNHVVDAFIEKQKHFIAFNKECQQIKKKLFQTKSDEERLIRIDHTKIVKEKEYILSSFIPSIEKLSSILQCFVSIAQQSLDGVLLLFDNELLLYLTNCSIFKSNDAQFVDPYLVDSGEENPCHELWCKTLELITYLLRQTAGALNPSMPSSLSTEQQYAMSRFMRNIMQFCSVHHDRILNKIGYIAHQDSDLRLRDLEEINIISSFIYEIEKNALLISQQSVDNRTEFELHSLRFRGLLHILSKFTILLESPEMLSSLTPPISTHEKYAFSHHTRDHNTTHRYNNNPHHSTTTDSKQEEKEFESDGLLQLQRQRSKHIQWASDVMTHQSNDEENVNAIESPLPLGKLLNKKERSVDTNGGDDEDGGGAEAALRRDQFLQRIEYYILDILKHILFCCRYEILDNWNHRNRATFLFTPNLRQQHFLSPSEGNSKPHLSVLVRLIHYGITHLKGLYQTQLSELNEEKEKERSGILRRSSRSSKKRADYMYDSKKVESEGKYHIVTWKNIEKTLWILFEHCYINLLLQIECFMQSNEELVLQYIVQYRNCLDKLWKRITRFESFLDTYEHPDCIAFANKEMKFITVLRETQHHQLIMNIEELRKKYLPHISIQRQSSDQTAVSNLSMRSQPMSDIDTMTDVTGGIRRISAGHGGFNQNQNRNYNYYSNYTPQSRHFSTARSNVSSSWA